MSTIQHKDLSISPLVRTTCLLLVAEVNSRSRRPHREWQPGKACNLRRWFQIQQNHWTCSNANNAHMRKNGERLPQKGQSHTCSEATIWWLNSKSISVKYETKRGRRSNRVAVTMFKDTIHARFTKAVRATADINRAVMASRHEINLDCERVHKVRIVQPRKKYNQTAIALQRV